MDEIGPVDYAIIAFPGNKFRGEIGPALADLVEANTIRIIDIAFVGKNADGEAVAFELTASTPTSSRAWRRPDRGEWTRPRGGPHGGRGYLQPENSAALIVWENVWARDVAQKMRDAGGVLVAFERIPHDVVQAAREFALEEAKA